MQAIYVYGEARRRRSGNCGEIFAEEFRARGKVEFICACFYCAVYTVYRGGKKYVRVIECFGNPRFVVVLGKD